MDHQTGRLRRLEEEYRRADEQMEADALHLLSPEARYERSRQLVDVLLTCKGQVVSQDARLGIVSDLLEAAGKSSYYARLIFELLYGDESLTVGSGNLP